MNILVYIAFALFVVAFAYSALLTKIVIRRSHKTNFLSHPQLDRYSKRTVALGGGVAIFWNMATAIISAIAIIYYLKFKYANSTSCLTCTQNFIDGFFNRVYQLIIILACLVVLHIVGMIDDKKHLGPKIKLFFQFLAAFLAAFFAEVRVELFIDNIFITSAISAFWIVLIINAFNFLDNMDGLSAGIAAIASSILVVAALKSGQIFVAGFGIVFVGTLCGFLVFNFPPAKVFMGDAGSLIVGFIVATLTLKTTYYHQTGNSSQVYSIFLPLIVMAVPLYDFTSVCFLRISHGKSPFVGDTQHFSHRIKRRGLTDTQTALTLYAATLCCGISGLFLYGVSLTQAILIFIQTLLILLLIAILESTGAANANT